MLLKTSTLTGCAIQATDGEIGTVSDFLFDDMNWSIRWLAVDTGSWLSGRTVLLPASRLGEARSGLSAIPADLAQEQVKNSLDVDTHQPVSRQMETSLYAVYGSEPNWATIALGVIGLAVAWMPLWLHRLLISLPMIAAAAGLTFFATERGEVSLVDYRQAGEIVTQVALIVSVMGAGLKIDRRFAIRTWASVWRLLGLVMPLSVAGIAVCAMGPLDLPPGYAVLLAGILAPTDPVLASSVQVGPPGVGRGKVRFALTAEAGLNDGLAFPFVTLGLPIIQNGPDPSRWLGKQFLVDLVWRTAAALAVGTGTSWVLVWVNRHLPERFRLARSRDGLVSVALTFLVYGRARRS